MQRLWRCCGFSEPCACDEYEQFVPLQEGDADIEEAEGDGKINKTRHLPRRVLLKRAPKSVRMRMCGFCVEAVAAFVLLTSLLLCARILVNTRKLSNEALDEVEMVKCEVYCNSIVIDSGSFSNPQEEFYTNCKRLGHGKACCCTTRTIIHRIGPAEPCAEPDSYRRIEEYSGEVYNKFVL